MSAPPEVGSIWIEVDVPLEQALLGARLNFYQLTCSRRGMWLRCTPFGLKADNLVLEKLKHEWRYDSDTDIIHVGNVSHFQCRRLSAEESFELHLHQLRVS